MSQQKKFMVSPRALQLAQNNYDISNAHFAHRVTQSSPYLAQIRSISRTLSRTHIARPADTDMPEGFSISTTTTIPVSCLSIMVSDIGDRDGAVHLEDEGGGGVTGLIIVYLNSSQKLR